MPPGNFGSPEGFAGIVVIGVLASPVALAQTVYGIVDVGYQHAKHTDGDVNKNFLQSGQQSGGSRFGVRGTEDLGAGTYATYQKIEFDVVAGTGATRATGMTQRETSVGLGGKSWGSPWAGITSSLTKPSASAPP